MRSKQILESVLPQFFPVNWLDAPGIVFTDFPSRIRIGYVLRNNGSYSYLLDDDIQSLDLTLEQLHENALANLGQLPSATISIAKVPEGSEGWIAATEDNFAAVRILLASVQQEFCKEFGDPFLVSIPHRDDCFCWSVTQTEERQSQHCRQVLADYLADDYNLTPDILLFERTGFRLHHRQLSDSSSPHQ